MTVFTRCPECGRGWVLTLARRRSKAFLLSLLCRYDDCTATVRVVATR